MPKLKPKTKQIRRKPQEIEEILAAYDGSDLSLREFATGHDLSASTIAGWLRRRRQAQAKPGQFVQIVGTTESKNLQIEDHHDDVPRGDFELAFEPAAHGVRHLRIASGFQPQDLGALLDVLNNYSRQD